MVWGLGVVFFSFAGMQLDAIALDHGPASIIAPIFSTNSLAVAFLSYLVFVTLILDAIPVFNLLFAGLIPYRIRIRKNSPEALRFFATFVIIQSLLVAKTRSLV